MPMLLRLLLLGLLVAVACPASAQVVNILPVLSTEPEKEGLTTEAGGSLSWLAGNINFLNTRASLLMRYKRGNHRIISRNEAELGASGDEMKPFLNRQIAHLRHQYRTTERVTWETYVQAAHDSIWRLRVRALAGAGPRLTLVRNEALNIAVGASYMFEHERLSVGEWDDSGLHRNNHRVSTYVMGAWRFDPRITLTQNLYVQPRFMDPMDVRVFSHTALAIKLTDRMSLSNGFLAAYNSRPPISIRRLDTTTQVQLALAF